MATPEFTTWTVDGRLCLQRGNGHRAGFLIKGVCYQPTPIGSGELKAPLGIESRKYWERDLPLLRAMRANAIRVYNMEGTDHTQFLDAAWNDGIDPIYVILGSPIHPGSFANPVDALVARYSSLASTYGTHPAVLGFSIGAEFNTDVDYPVAANLDAEYWNRFKAIVNAVRQHVGHTKIITTGLIERWNEFFAHAFTKGVDVDLWGIDLYKTNASFHQAWDSYDDLNPGKPMLVGEFGVPASKHVGTLVTELPAPTGDETARTTRALTSYMETVWRKIEQKHVGGFIFEWTDEWWKQQGVRCNSSLHSDSAGDTSATRCGTSTHDGSTDAADYFEPGAFWDEEWFGINAIAPGDPNELIPRVTYDLFLNLWNVTTMDNITVELPANSRIFVTGMINTSGWRQQITVEPAGHAALVWNGGDGPEFLNHVIGQVVLPRFATASQMTVRLAHDSGSGMRGSTIRRASFTLPGLDGYVIGGQDSGGRPTGPAFWNTVVLIYWAKNY